MSRDSHPTQLHLHAPHHADLFEEFCRPPSTYTSTNSTSNNNTSSNPHSANRNSLPHPTSLHPSSSQNPPLHPPSPSAAISLPGHFLPFDPIPLPHHLQPLNPEDEDGIVPDQHAAFGILRALPSQPDGGNVHGEGENGVNGRGEESRRGNTNAEPAWRELGMEGLLEGGNARGGEVRDGGETGAGGGEAYWAGLRGGMGGYGGLAANVQRAVPGVVAEGVGGLGREGFARRRGAGGLR